MSTQTFVNWRPHSGIPWRLEVLGIQDENDGLVLVLADEATRRPSVKLSFEDFVAYRNVNESWRSRTWGAHDMRSCSSLLIVEGSHWLEWLREESGGVLSEIALTHYAIYTGDDCVDVASRRPPIVVILSATP